MTLLGNERRAVQTPLLRYAEEAGWTYLDRDEALRLRQGTGGLLLHEVFVAQVQRLNPGVVDRGRAEELVRRLSRVAPTIEGNLDAWEYLKGRKTVFVEDENRERDIRLLDPDHPDANTFHVTDELTYDNGTPPPIRPDVVFFINGIPVIDIETKAATNVEGIDDGLVQLRRYHRDGPELMALLQLAAVTNVLGFFYGATWSLIDRALFNWRDEHAGSFEDLVKTFVAPRRVLRALADFILFTRTDGELAKIVLRPHQMRAVERVTGRARERSKRRGLVWHTQGSGKTYTMIATARKLLVDPAFGGPTVLMLIDRTDLEDQLARNLASVGFKRMVEADSKEHLRSLLRQDYRGLIVSTIHKFEGIPANLSSRENIYVLVDEAHRSTGGHLGNYLVGALPNATYIGFTGTPINKTAQGGGTFKTFGVDDERGYLDKYSIRESIAEGTTLPLHYALAPNDLQVDREVLEREFLDLPEVQGIADVDALNRVLEKAVTLRNMLKNRDRVERVARHVAQHFRDNVEPMGYKALLVGVDREACALFKEALDRYLPTEYSEVVISSAHNDPPRLARYRYTEDEDKAIRKAFRRPDGVPKILIVTEKLLTGFDAPILYAMYLDKPMRDHVLLQAIARVNRPYEDDAQRRKPAGFILDYVGLFDKLEKALAYDSEDVAGVVEGLDVLRERFTALMANGREEYLPIAAGKAEDKAVEAVLEHFRDAERRDELYSFFGELEEVYEILSPDVFLRPFLADFDTLARIYQMVRTKFDPGISTDKTLLRKTSDLVQTHTRSGVIREPAATYVLDETSLHALVEQDTPDVVKVFNLIKALHDLVEQRGSEQPFLIPIGERAEQIAELFANRQMSTEKALQEFTGIAEDYEEAEREYRESDLSREAFATFWYLRGKGVADARPVANAAQSAFAAHPYWRTDPKAEMDVRKDLYKALIAAGTRDGIKDLVDDILSDLRRA